MSIEACDIRRTFGSFEALKGVSLEVGPGALVALLGPSGSGKTTLLRILAGLESADPGSGRVLLGGEDVTGLPPGRRKIGFVFQHYALFRHMSVFENVAFGLRVRPRRERLDSHGVTARVRHLLDLVQLPRLEGRYPHQLSGGQRQRVALARALAVEPKVLLLDEPFGALDAKVRKELRRWLRRFHDEIGLTTLFVTHDQEEALEIADQVVVMDHGRIEQVGTPGEVYDRPASPFVHQFIGSVNVLRASGLREWGAPDAAARDGRFFVRPQDIEVIGPGRSEGVPALVRHIHAAGPQARLTLEHVLTREFLDAEISRAELAALGLKAGDIVRLRLRQVRFFDEGYVI